MCILGTGHGGTARGPAPCGGEPLSLQSGNGTVVLPEPVFHAYPIPEDRYVAGGSPGRHGRVQRRHYRHGRNTCSAGGTGADLAGTGGAVHPAELVAAHQGNAAGTRETADGGRGVAHGGHVPHGEPDGFPPFCWRTFAVE